MSFLLMQISKEFVSTPILVIFPFTSAKLVFYMYILYLFKFIKYKKERP